MGFDCWKEKSVVKLWIFCATLKKALPASFCPPSVSCNRLSSRPVLPLNVIDEGAAAKPTEKLGPTAYNAIATGLLERPVAVAIAWIVVVWLTASGAA